MALPGDTGSQTRERTRFRANPAKRIHVTGSPRSGTTLLLALMLACFDIDGGVPNERRLWRKPPKGREVVCTKFPDEADFATQMLPLDPDLHVIFIVRDPRDVIASQSHLDPGRYLTNLRVWKQNLAAARPWFGHRRFHVIDYSELASDPDRIQAQLAEDLPFLRITRPFSRFFECAHEEGGEWLAGMHMKLRPIAPDRVGSWRRHLRRVKGQMLIHGDICHELMLLGFESDRTWLAELDGVRPDVRASAAIERFNLGKRITRAWRNSLGALIYVSRRHFGIEFSQTGEKKPQLVVEGFAANENRAVKTESVNVVARKSVTA